MPISRLAGLSLRWLLVLIAVLACGKAFSIEPEVYATALRAKYTELSPKLLNNQFHRPLWLVSAETATGSSGDIYAEIDYPFADVSTALNNPAHWCDVLILHIDIKYCRAVIGKTGTALTIKFVEKYDKPIADAYLLDFNYRGVVATPEYFAVELYAETGPLGTHDYHIRLEATTVKDGRTFLHFTYAYSFGLTGRLAIQGYLLTLGRNKVGFTVTGQQFDGQPTYIKGIRGVVERNAMRYFLAIDGYLAALVEPPEAQFEKRLQYWYNGADLYARQLHEAEREEYFAMKRMDYQGQHVVQ